MNYIKVWYDRDLHNHSAIVQRGGVASSTRYGITPASEQRLTRVAHKIARQVEGARFRPFRCPGTTGWVLQWET